MSSNNAALLYLVLEIMFFSQGKPFPGICFLAGAWLFATKDS